MKCKSGIEPQPYEVRHNGSNALVVLCENIEKTTITEEENISIEYTFDRYTLDVSYRHNLEIDVAKNTDKWLDIAKRVEYEKLADEIRERRNKLLSECDSEVAIDRLNLEIPDKITTSTLLTSVKSVFEGLFAVLNSDIAKYRQALRDVPQQEGFPYDVKFPVKPNTQ